MNDGEDDPHSAALALNVSDKEVAEMEQRLQGDYSLDAEMACADGLTALESLADERMNQEALLAEFQENQQLQQKVAQVVAVLNEKERFIIERRITSDEPMTLQEIATHFSISRERVRQIEEGALKKVKNSLLPLLSAA
jgi:RNA polymerase sigma-32 factor